MSQYPDDSSKFNTDFDPNQLLHEAQWVHIKSDKTTSQELAREVEEANKNIFGSDQKGVYNPFALPSSGFAPS